MSLPAFLIKVCGITCLEDALTSVEYGANALGFNFYKRSVRYIDPAEAARIIAALPADILKAGVFVDEPAASMAALGARIGLDVLQLHGAESPSALPAGWRAWKALKVDDAFAPSQADAWPVEAVLLDSSAGGSGRVFDWRRARGLSRPVILAGGLDAWNVAEAVSIARPHGVDACSRLECAPGRKDPERVKAFIRKAIEAHQALLTV
jgi:phosphoribosylanthranilate isomerase